MHKWFSSSAINCIQQAIAKADGAQVLLCATIPRGVLESFRAITRDTLLELPKTAWARDNRLVVVCSYPTGDLSPKGVDITAASFLARAGIGYAIVDSQVSKAYILTEPESSTPSVSISVSSVAAALGPEGYVSKAMPLYEDRPQQLEMAGSIAGALNEGAHVLAEAGTGLGKSLAYLVPQLYWAKENKRRVVISTNTINLQEQLLYKDVPLLQRGLPFEFVAALVKGRANYLCKRRLRELAQQEGSLLDDGDLPGLNSLLAWAETTREGARQDLPFDPGGHWDLVCSDSDTCLYLDCPHFRDCFFYSARRTALGAQLLIANHSLLFADIALRLKGANSLVLPDYDGLVLDEAHNIEKTATEWLGGRVTRLSLIRLLARLYSIRANRVKGLLAILENKIVAAAKPNDEWRQSLLTTIRQKFIPECILAEEKTNGFFAAADALLSEREGRSSRLRLTAQRAEMPGWKMMLAQAENLFLALGTLAETAESLRSRLEGLGPEDFESVLPEAIEIDGIRVKLKGLEADLREVLFGKDESLVRWAELKATRRGPRTAFSFAPLAVDAVLKESLWSRLPSVTLTSATLTVGGDFSYIRERLGLDGSCRVREMVFESPFDFQEQVRLGVATDLPEPTERDYWPAAVSIVESSLQGSRGRGLVLFTSFASLEAIAGPLAQSTVLRGMTLLKQGDGPRHRLLEEFKGDTNSVLFATSSFWEGIDVPGDSLSNLILTRLPFNVPDEPVFQARMEQLERQGKNPFYSLQLPQAILRFKQGFGRLIRHRQDRGVVLVLDKRIATRKYGRWFLDSLPSCSWRAGRSQDILEWQKEFLWNPPV